MAYNPNWPKRELDYTDENGLQQSFVCVPMLVKDEDPMIPIKLTWTPLVILEWEIDAYYKEHFPERYKDLMFNNQNIITEEMINRFLTGDFKMTLVPCDSVNGYEVVSQLSKIPPMLSFPCDSYDETEE